MLSFPEVLHGETTLVITEAKDLIGLSGTAVVGQHECVVQLWLADASRSRGSVFKACL